MDLNLNKSPILFWINKKEVNTAPPIRKKEIPVVDSDNKGTIKYETKNIIIAKNEEWYPRNIKPIKRPQNNPNDEPFNNAVNIERTEYEPSFTIAKNPNNVIHKYIFCNKSNNKEIEEERAGNFLGSAKRLLNSFWIKIYEIKRNPPTNKIKLSFE